ncbi:MAG: TetR/AcrR family transcriptional regulator [Acidimicrobiia bacterium]|nr:TetR/AcrR family transcriptional regulator [Acidimicrobiia bacterium]
MSHSGWQRHSDGEVAIDKILDAAGRTFARCGVRHATMIDVARAAGCSRATLYRYFPNQEALHLAFVHRATLRIALRLAEDRRGGAPPSLADRILAGIAAVRADPLLAVWFEPENMAVPIAVSQNSELLQAMSSGLVDQVGSGALGSEELERRGEWLLRCIVSLLAMPGADDEAERVLVESYVVPGLVTDADQTRSHN